MRRYLCALAIILPILATQAHAEERPLYNAQDTIRRAQIGKYSPRLAQLVRIAPAPTLPDRPKPSRYERMDCRPDPSRPPDRTIICTPMNPEKVK